MAVSVTVTTLLESRCHCAFVTVACRLYVQLPTAAAHEYHLDAVVDVSEQPPDALSSRLHPSVAQKIRDIVSGGELRQYCIRHLLRLLLLLMPSPLNCVDEGVMLLGRPIGTFIQLSGQIWLP